jgi:opacity protein-like surface antigen
MSWFAGGSIGYLTELEEPMYNLHVGITDSCWKVAGCNVSFFLEVGYTQTDESYQYNDGDYSGRWDEDGQSFTIDELGQYLQGQANWHGDHDDGPAHPETYDLQIIPITLNIKFDRALTGNLNAYLGAGMGMANVSLDINDHDIGDVSEDDWVFTAQIFGGLSYSFTPAFEVYGGARWIYYQSADLGGNNTLELEDDCLLELGARYKF